MGHRRAQIRRRLGWGRGPFARRGRPLEFQIVTAHEPRRINDHAVDESGQEACELGHGRSGSGDPPRSDPCSATARTRRRRCAVDGRASKIRTGRPVVPGEKKCVDGALPGFVMNLQFEAVFEQCLKHPAPGRGRTIFTCREFVGCLASTSNRSESIHREPPAIKKSGFT